MKRNNPATNQPFRCGDYNPDTNMYFRAYNKQRMRRDGTYVEMWLTPESFTKIRERMKLRARERRTKEAFRRERTAQQIIAALG